MTPTLPPAVRRLVLVTALAFAMCSPAMAALDPSVAAVRTALQSGTAEKAVAAAERAVVGRAADPEAWYYAGQAYGRMAMEVSMLRKASWATKAHEALRKAATLDPSHLGAREGLVQFYRMAPGFMGGGADKADAEIADYARRNPAGGRYLKAMTLKGAAAEAELRAAVQLAPDEPRYRRALVTMLDRDARTADALKVLDDGLRRTPAEPRLLYLLGRYAATRGDRIDDGIAALDRVIAQGAALPDDVSLGGAYWRRGQLLEKRDRAADALSDYRRAVALAPSNADAKKDLARLSGKAR